MILDCIAHLLIIKKALAIASPVLYFRDIIINTFIAATLGSTLIFYLL
jgi:hypothetical protein